MRQIRGESPVTVRIGGIRWHLANRVDARDFAGWEMAVGLQDLAFAKVRFLNRGANQPPFPVEWSFLPMPTALDTEREPQPIPRERGAFLPIRAVIRKGTRSGVEYEQQHGAGQSGA